MKISLQEIKKMIQEEVDTMVGQPQPTSNDLSQHVYKIYSDFNYKLNN